MRSILIAVFVAISMIASGTTVEDGIPEVEQSTTEIPTTVASSWEATPIPNTVETQNPEPEPTPASLPEDGYVLTSEDLQILEELTAYPPEVDDKLIIKTDLFKIEYLISNQQFFVLLKTLPVEEAKLAAEEWFVDQGFSPQSLCLIRINFYPSDLTVDEWGAELDVPTGCDIPSS